MSWLLLAGGTALHLYLAWAGGGWLADQLPAIAAVTLAGAALVLTARALHDDAAAERTGWLWLLLPLFTDAASFAGDAAPLVAAAAWTTWAVARAVEAPRAAHWLLAGAAAGLTAAMDVVAVPMLAGVLLAAARVHELRRHARTPGPWLGLALAVGLGVALRPLLTGPIEESALVDRAFLLGRDVLLLVTPAVAVLAVVAQVVALRAGARPARTVLAAMGLAGLVGAALLALAGWSAPGAAPVAALPGLVVLATSAIPERSRWWRPALAVALVGSLILVVLRAQAG